MPVCNRPFNVLQFYSIQCHISSVQVHKHLAVVPCLEQAPVHNLLNLSHSYALEQKIASLSVSVAFPTDASVGLMQVLFAALCSML